MMDISTPTRLYGLLLGAGDGLGKFFCLALDTAHGLHGGSVPLVNLMSRC